MQALLKVEQIKKSFGPTKALRGVDMELKSGEIHGLIGENGSGKSTLSSIVAAVYRADSGTMYIDGKTYDPYSMQDAVAGGVSMIAQEQATFAGMDVASNIFIGKEKMFERFGLLSVRKMKEDANKALANIGADHIKASQHVENLSFEERKLVEIARAMWFKPKILIIDETTNALTVKGRQILYDIMRKHRDNGGGVIFISHDIEEVMSICDTLTILRDGEVTSTLSTENMNADKIKQLMIGREFVGDFYRPGYESSHMDEIMLECKNVSDDILNDISLQLYKGEILGIGGLADCGMHKLGKVMFGLSNPENGSVKTGSGTVIDNPQKAIKNSIGYISKNRDKESLMTAGTIRENTCLPSLDDLNKGGLITPRTERRFTEKWSEVMQVKMNNIDQKCSELSGGNKQKVVLGRWLGKGSDILILDCPTRGIDIGVKEAIYKLMCELKDQGKAILMISEELPELIGMSDRILIMKDGKISGVFKREQRVTESEIINYMI